MEKKFIKWLASQELFKGMSEDAVIKEINALVEKDPDTVKALVSEFNKSQKFEKGGKIDSMVSKLQQGGAALRRARRQEYRNAMDEYRNDAEMNKYRRGYLRDLARERANAVEVPATTTPERPERLRPSEVYDRDEARQIMLDKGVRVKQTRTDWDGNVVERTRRGNVGDGRVLVKKAKSAAVDGFDESMYNWNPDQEFDRARFRERKRIARLAHPEYNWRQRRAWALKDVGDIPKQESVKRVDIQYTPDYKIGHVGPIDTNVNWEDYMNVPEIAPIKRYNQVRHTKWYNPQYGDKVSFNQFAGLLDDRMRKDKSLQTGSDLRAFQAHRAREYERYMADPENYMWRDMDASYVGSKQFLEDEKWARENGLLANKRGAGYYNPEDSSFASRSLFRDKSAKQMLDALGPRSTQEIYMVDETGRRLSDDEVMAISMDPEHQYAFRGIPVERVDSHPQTSTVGAQNTTIGQVPESKFSDAMNAVQAGIVATAAAPVIIQSTAAAAKDLGGMAYNTGKQMIQNGRSIYGRSPQGMLQQNRWYTWSQSRLPNGHYGPNVFKGGRFTTGFGNGYGQMAPHAYNLWQPGMKLSGEVISQLPGYLQTMAPFLKEGGKIEK